MSLDGHVFTAADGVKGFDANRVITPDVAEKFFAHGYRFCVRYVRRDPAHDFDLSADEAEGLIESGLGLMPVQHVESEDGWTPNPEKGAAYGAEAAKECDHIGVPSGVCVWCGLEGGDLTTPAELYRALRFTHYWGAYNLNSDEAPAVRGLQMKQSSPKALDAVAGCAFEFQVDTVRGDALGGHPTLIAREGWPE